MLLGVMDDSGTYVKPGCSLSVHPSSPAFLGSWVGLSSAADSGQFCPQCRCPHICPHACTTSDPCLSPMLLSPFLSPIFCPNVRP